MMRKILLPLVLATFALPVIAQTPGPQIRIAVLQNGAIFKGVVEEQADQCIIETLAGSRLVINVDRLSFVCDSMPEAYWQRLARTRASDVEGQIEVFQWCVKHELFEEAKNQFRILMDLDIKATRLDSLHRQLNVSVEQQIAQQQRAAHEQLAARRESNTVESNPENPFNIRPLPSMETPQSVADNTDPSMDSPQQVQQVGFNQPIEREEAGPTPKTKPEVSIQELDDLTKSLPKPAVAMFKRRVEPLIARSCYAGGCHHTESDVMPLMRLARSQIIPRRMSQRNMYNMLLFADANRPLESKLLRAAMVAHGGQTEPTIEPGTVQFENLARWLIMVSNFPDRPHPDTRLQSCCRRRHPSRPGDRAIATDQGRCRVLNCHLHPGKQPG